MYESGAEHEYEEEEDNSRLNGDAELDSPSNYSKSKVWYDRSQYAIMLRDLIAAQLTNYKHETNRSKKTNISKNIAYLIQVINQLVKDEKGIESRLSDLEDLAGIVKKTKITT